MGKRKDWHPSLTRTVILDASNRRLTSLDNPGFCLTKSAGCPNR